MAKDPKAISAPAAMISERQGKEPAGIRLHYTPELSCSVTLEKKGTLLGKKKKKKNILVGQPPKKRRKKGATEQLSEHCNLCMVKLHPDQRSQGSLQQLVHGGFQLHFGVEKASHVSNGCKMVYLLRSPGARRANSSVSSGDNPRRDPPYLKGQGGGVPKFRICLFVQSSNHTRADISSARNPPSPSSILKWGMKGAEKKRDRSPRFLRLFFVNGHGSKALLSRSEPPNPH